MLSVQDLRVTVPTPEGEEAELLHGISFESRAKTLAVIGENGSGKSTLAKVLAGILQFSSGMISVEPKIAPGSDRPRRRFELTPGRAKLPKELRGRIGMIFAQASAQVIMPTVAEDVALSLRGRKLSKEEVNERVAAALAEHELTELADRTCYSLSSGQLQRLALCAVLIGEPDLVIADEPTSMLDARHERIIRNRLLGLPETTQMIVVTHDLDMAARCEEAIWIHQGSLAGQGKPAEVIDQYLGMLDLDDDGYGATP